MKYLLRTIFTLYFFFSFIPKERSKRMYPQWIDPPFALDISTGKLDNVQINEASGLVASRSNPQALWTHNDSGDEARFFLINEMAKHLGTFYLEGATHRDWEDMALSTENGINYLFLADIGDNMATSELKVIYKVPEPKIENRVLPLTDTLKNIQKITYRYPDGNRDAECLMIDPLTNDLIIISKREDNVHIYLAPFPQSTSTIITLTKVGTLPFGEVVAGDIAPDGKEILLKDYTSVFYWKKEGNESIAQLLQKPFQNLPYIQEPQGEAIAWKSDNSGYYTLSEGGWASLLFYKRK
jgi:hypothetical protein